MVKKALKFKDDIEALNNYIEKTLIPSYVRNNNGSRFIFSYVLRRKGFDDEQVLYIIDYLKKIGIDVHGEDGLSLRKGYSIASSKKLSKEENKKYLSLFNNIKILESKTNDIKEKNKLEQKKQEVRNIIVEGNIKFAQYMSYKYKKYYQIPLEDLESISYYALIRAVELFDLKYNTSFTTFASRVIISEIVRYIKEYYHLEPGVVNILSRLDKNNDLDENMDELDEYLVRYDYRNAKEKIKVFYPKSLDEQEKNSDIKDNNDYEKNISNDNLKNKISKVLDKLSDKERYIIINYFGLEGKRKTYEELGKEFNVTHQSINLVLKGALSKIRRLFSKELIDLLDNNYNYTDNIVYECHQRVLKKSNMLDE